MVNQITSIEEQGFVLVTKVLFTVEVLTILHVKGIVRVRTVLLIVEVSLEIIQQDIEGVGTNLGNVSYRVFSDHRIEVILVS